MHLIPIRETGVLASPLENDSLESFKSQVMFFGSHTFQSYCPRGLCIPKSLLHCYR